MTQRRRSKDLEAGWLFSNSRKHLIGNVGHLPNPMYLLFSPLKSFWWAFTLLPFSKLWGLKVRRTSSWTSAPFLSIPISGLQVVLPKNSLIGHRRGQDKLSCHQTQKLMEKGGRATVPPRALSFNRIKQRAEVETSILESLQFLQSFGNSPPAPLAWLPHPTSSSWVSKISFSLAFDVWQMASKELNSRGGILNTWKDSPI